MSSKEKFEKAKIAGIYMAMTKHGPSPIAVLKESGGKVLPLFIGYRQAIAIQSYLEGNLPPWPSVFDFALALIKDQGAKIDNVIIELGSRDVIESYVVVISDKGVKKYPIGPGDGLAVSLYAQSDVLISKAIFDKYGVDEETLAKRLRKP